MSQEIVNIELVENNGSYFVSSKEVARRFEKEHYQVLRDYRNLASMLQDANFIGYNFVVNKINTLSGKEELSEILMTKNGFSLLAMGFTGKDAAQWKVKFITAFDQMDQIIQKELPALRAQIKQLQIQNRTALPPPKKEHGNKNRVLVPVQINTLFGTDLEYIKVERKDDRYSELSYMEGQQRQFANMLKGIANRMDYLTKEIAMLRRK